MDSYGLNCPHCGYNLSGLKKPLCPECGIKFDPVYLRGLNRKYPGVIEIGFWTVKYIPPVFLVGSALYLYFYGDGPHVGMVAFRSLAYAVMWICVVWTIEEFIP